MNTKKLLATLLTVAVVLIGGCKKDKFSKIDGVCPIVIHTDPLDGATGVPLEQVIRVTFNEEMNPATITHSSFILQASLNVQGITTISGDLTYDQTSATFSFVPTTELTSNTTYTGRVTTAVQDLTGNALQEDYIWSFSTGDFISPMVIYTDPANQATGVVLNKTLIATFNMPMDPATINDSTFTLLEGFGTKVTGTVSYSGTSAYFTPTSALLANAQYTATISAEASNVAGRPMDNDYVWIFTTLSNTPPVVISTDPADTEIDVVLNKTVTATFNMAMDPLTINSGTFTLYNGLIPVAGNVSYSGTMAFFDPASDLTSGTTYTATITNGAKNMGGFALASDYVWTFTTGTTVAPTVISTDPAHLATNVVLNKLVTATFSEVMDASTITPSSTFTIKQGSTVIAGTVSYSGTKATFTPNSNFLPGLTYTGRITTAAKNVAGIPMANDYVWTFTTLTIPIVISTDPANNATGVVLNKIVTATFSMIMNPTTINGTTFTLKQGGNNVAGVVTYSGSKASFTPASALLPNTTYTGTITTGAQNTFGTPLASNYVWTFTTGSLVAPLVISTDPANLATGVVLDKTITATFNMPMNGTTLTTSTFTLKRGTTPVTGVVSYLGTTASFKPTVKLLAGTTYTATITTGAKATSGAPLASDYVWTFTTLVLPPPTVISTDPANLATGVAFDKTVTATFSVPMDPTTIKASTFILKTGTSIVAGVYSYSGSTASFNPTVNLLPGTTYTATITTGAKNMDGTALASDYVWTFTTLVIPPPTVISTDPADKATNVDLSKTVTATFSVPMDASTINSTTFTLKMGSTTVPGAITYSGSTASYNPTNNLLSDTTYTATITTGAKNTYGIPMLNNYVWTFSTKAHLGPKGPDLKSAARFGILAYSTVTNNAGASEINNMDVGLYPGTAVSGFPPGKVNNGAIYTSAGAAPIPAMLIQAKADLTAAYLAAEAATSPAPTTVSGNQGGKTLAPGIYKSTSTLSVNGSDLTLDAQGDANAVWIFQIASTLITTTGGNIVLSGGAQAKNIYWQVGSSATIGGYTKFSGNVLALISITMNGYAVATGRMLTQTGAVTLTSTDIINKP